MDSSLDHPMSDKHGTLNRPVSFNLANSTLGKYRPIGWLRRGLKVTPLRQGHCADSTGPDFGRGARKIADGSSLAQSEGSPRHSVRIAAWNCATYQAMLVCRSMSVSAADEAAYALLAMR